MPQHFDLNKALKALQDGQALTGKDGILIPLIKQLIEADLTAELDSHCPKISTLTVKMIAAKKPSKLKRVLSNWQYPVTVTARWNLNW